MLNRKGTPIGLQVKDIIQKGGLVSDDIVYSLATTSYHSMLDFCGKSPRILFDGFPRTVPQAKALDNAENPIKIHLALFIDVPSATLIERLSGRWIHAASGRTYATDYNPPKKVYIGNYEYL
jgi:adenylate kinase